MSQVPHPFEGVALGVADRPCTRCGLADRAPVHQLHVVRRSSSAAIAELLEAGNRLANVVENSLPKRVLERRFLANALSQWDDACRSAEEVPG